MHTQRQSAVPFAHFALSRSLDPFPSHYSSRSAIGSSNLSTLATHSISPFLLRVLTYDHLRPSLDIFLFSATRNRSYVKKSLVSKGATIPSLATSIWEAVKTNNVREVYRLIVISDAIIINTIYDEVAEVGLSHNFHEHDSSEIINTVKSNDPATCDKMTGYYSKPESCLQGCSLLHLACHSGNTIMLELLLQFGADINWCDYHGRTPLHHCICAGNNHVAKFLLRRGARASIKDGGGFGALERAMEIGAITDEELFVLLAECQ